MEFKMFIGQNCHILHKRNKTKSTRSETRNNNVRSSGK